MPAAAPNVPALFDFEGQFESAAQEILEEVLINSYKTGDDQALPVEAKTLIAFDVGPAVDGKPHQIPAPASWPATDRHGLPMARPQEYVLYTASLEYRIEAPNDDRAPTIEGVSSKMAEIRGRLREVMMQANRPFNEVNLPYYRVTKIRPDGASYGTGANNTERAFVRFALNFEIRDTAWPTWVEP